MERWTTTIKSRKSHPLPQPPPPSVEDPITGIVWSVVEVEMERNDPDVFIVAAQTADTIAYGFPHKVASNGSGCGLSYQAAYGAAVGECVERYAFSIVHPEDLLFGSFIEMCQQSRSPIAPERWALFAPHQYDHIPFAPFHKDTRIAWMRAENLTHRQECLVPACLVHIPYPRPFVQDEEKVIAPAISTGAACARSRTEALLKGICEVVERDAFMIMWRNRLSCPRVIIDPGSELHSLFKEKFSRPGLEFTLVYTTLDLSIPSFCGILKDIRRNPPGIIVGGSAHPNPHQAAIKTLLELVQGLKWMDYIASEPFSVEPGFRNVRSFKDHAHLYAVNNMGEAFNFLYDHSSEIPLSTIPSIDVQDLRANLRHVITLLAAHGLEVIAVDLTSVDIQECGFYTVKVLIPECEPMEGDHLIPFLAGSRWRELPYRLGCRSSPSTFDEMNPYPHPYM